MDTGLVIRRAGPQHSAAYYKNSYYECVRASRNPSLELLWPALLGMMYIRQFDYNSMIDALSTATQLIGVSMPRSTAYICIRYVLGCAQY